MGGNPAENHPCGFKWPIEAKLARNAKMIVVDPRFTRTAANADLFLQIRAGSRHRVPRRPDQLRDRARTASRTTTSSTTRTPSFIVKEGFKLPEDGLYSGFDPATQTYDKSTWNYEAGGRSRARPRQARPAAAAVSGAGRCRTKPGRAAAIDGWAGPGAARRRSRFARASPRTPPCRRTSPTTLAAASRAASSSCSSSSTRATRRRWSSASPGSRRISS